MTLQTIDFVQFAEKPNILLVVIISVIIFIVVSLISGFIAYKLKVKKIRQKKDDENDKE